MNKKILIAVLLVSVSFFSARAQKFDINKVRISIKGGLNVSSFTDDVSVFDPASPGYKNSFYSYFEKYSRITGTIGIAADYPINNRFTLSAGLEYNGRGSAYRVQNGGVVVYSNGSTESDYNYYRFQLDYVELPLLAQYNVADPHGSSSVILYGGISPAVNVKAGTSYTYATSGSTPVTGGTASNNGSLPDVSSFMLSPVAGIMLGGNRNKPYQFFGDIRFEYSLLPVFNKSSDNGENLQTSMITGGLSLGVRF